VYRHTQRATVLLLVLIASAVVPIAILLVFGGMIPPGVKLALLSLALPLFLFSSLTTEVTSETFSFHFGAGLIRRSFSIADILRCQTVTNPWYFGLGIHLTPRGWLYNVAGSEAVELELRNGRHLLVGSDEPRVLCAAIEAAIHSRA
jgi:hypothetical protein